MEKLSVVEKSPSHAFGIKHSPYVGSLKGDAWVGAKTELSTPVAARKGASLPGSANQGYAVTSGSSGVRSVSVANGSGASDGTRRVHI